MVSCAQPLREGEVLTIRLALVVSPLSEVTERSISTTLSMSAFVCSRTPHYLPSARHFLARTRTESSTTKSIERMDRDNTKLELRIIRADDQRRKRHGSRSRVRLEARTAVACMIYPHCVANEAFESYPPSGPSMRDYNSSAHAVYPLSSIMELSLPRASKRGYL